MILIIIILLPEGICPCPYPSPHHCNRSVNMHLSSADDDVFALLFFLFDIGLLVILAVLSLAVQNNIINNNNTITNTTTNDTTTTTTTTITDTTTTDTSDITVLRLNINTTNTIK